MGSLESVESESLLTNGGSTNVLDCLISLEECNEEILNSDDFLVPRQLTIQNDMGIACHPEPVTETQYKKSSFHFPHNKEGARMLQPINYPVRPLTLTLSRRERENQASLGKGGGREVPEGLRKFTLTRIAKFTKFIKQFNPLTKREGKELGYTKFYSRTYTVLTPHPSPLTLRERKNQAFLGKGGGTEVPEGFKKRKAAFTLAEVLITLGIIGVVAAMTLPALIQKNNNKVVETRLKKFYSTMNQAIMMAEVDYGDKKIWYEDVAGAEIDKDGNIVPGSSKSEKWFRKYLAPYLQTTKIETVSSGSYKGSTLIYFPDGSAVRIHNDTTRDWHFFQEIPINV